MQTYSLSVIIAYSNKGKLLL